MKLSTRSDKTACSRWQANQLRLFLHMGAYWLLHSLRLAAPKRSRWRGATFATIRSVFVKIAVRVEEMKRSIKLAFPCHLPHANALAPVTGRLTAQGPRPTRPMPPEPRAVNLQRVPKRLATDPPSTRPIRHACRYRPRDE